MRSLAGVQPLHVATWIEAEASAPTVKQRLAAIRHLFDWLVVGQIVPANPASSVRGPKHIVTKGKTPVLERAEARALLDSIDTRTPAGLRDRAHRRDGLFLRAHRRRADNEGRGRLQRA